MAAKNKPNEIYITHVYNAPVKAVWDAWTDPKQVAQWWGPRGFTLTTHSKDLRPGGHWTYTMHGPDGTDYPNKTHYFEVEKHARLVYDHGGHDDRPALFRVTVTFQDLGGKKTRMEMTMALATAEAAAETRKFIKKAGGDSTWDRLAEYLAKEASGKEKFVINRSFATSQTALFKMWTDPKHLAKWLPPTGFTMEFLRADIRTGGSSFYVMTNGSMKMHGSAQYLEVSPSDRFVYTQQFRDENEKLSRHPALSTWPASMLTTVEFSEEGPEQTRVTVTWEVDGQATHEEIESFIQHRASMTQGWTGSFDKLEDLLGK